MHAFRTTALTFLVLLATGCLSMLPLHAGESAAEQEKALLNVLNGNAPKAEKAITCKKLLLCGSGACVPALAALLSDPELASWARIPLEGIPDPAVNPALREAAGKLNGRLLIGVINSLGVRRDEQAVGLLSAKLKDADVEVVAAAAAALGRIGGPQATEALTAFLPSSPAAARTDAAEGCLLCADRLTAEGKNAEAVKVYELVRKADVPKQQVLEAIRGEILAQKADGIPLLLEQLRSDDKDFFGIGLRTARELPGTEATAALVEELGKTKPERQSLLVLALADRGDPKALEGILTVIQKGSKDAALAALASMERIGNASCIPVLAQVAAEGEKDQALAAKAALVKLPGADIDTQIGAQLSAAQGKTREVLIEVVGFRRAEAAAATLIPFLEDADAGVRKAAASAIATTGNAKEVPAVVKALLKTKDADERAGFERALTGCAARGGTSCGAEILPLLQNDDPAVRIVALHALVCAGGSDALKAVEGALSDKVETVQDEAVRSLSTWSNRWPNDAGVAAPLLKLAQTGQKPVHQILALRGYLQYLQGAKDLKDDAVLARLDEVLPLIKRPDEKRLACSVLGTTCSATALTHLVAMLEDPAIAEEACLGVLSLLEKKELKGVSAEQRQNALQLTIEKSKDAQTKKKATQMLKRK